MLRRKDPRKRLAILPLIGDEIDPREASVDLRLGHHFLVPRGIELPELDPLEMPASTGEPFEPEAVGLQRLWLPDRGEIHLHPGEFILAATLEYIGLPAGVCAEVLGRSSWARVGLVVQMASFVHPGYRGCLTLEMQNLGSTSIVLRPRYRVAHLVLLKSSSKAETPSPSQITCAIRPEIWPLVSPSEKAILSAP